MREKALLSAKLVTSAKGQNIIASAKGDAEDLMQCLTRTLLSLFEQLESAANKDIAMTTFALVIKDAAHRLGYDNRLFVEIVPEDRIQGLRNLFGIIGKTFLEEDGAEK